MTTLRHERKTAALNGEKYEELPRSTQARDANYPRSQGDFIPQVSEEFEGKVSKKISQEFSSTESCFLGTPSRTYAFLLKPLNQCRSGSALETSRNPYGINQGTKANDFQSGRQPKARVSQYQTTRNLCPADGYDVTTITECRHSLRHDSLHNIKTLGIKRASSGSGSTDLGNQ